MGIKPPELPQRPISSMVTPPLKKSHEFLSSESLRTKHLTEPVGDTGQSQEEETRQGEMQELACGSSDPSREWRTQWGLSMSMQHKFRRFFPRHWVERHQAKSTGTGGGAWISWL